MKLHYDTPHLLSRTINIVTFMPAHETLLVHGHRGLRGLFGL